VRGADDENDDQPGEHEDLPARAAPDVEEVSGQVEVPEAAQPGSQSQPHRQVVVTTQYAHSGPLPDQRWFAEVEQVHPGATELILTDYRDQRQHEREMEKEAIALDRVSFQIFARYQTTQLLIAGGLATLLAVAGIVLIAVGLPIGGLVILIAEIAALAATFLGRGRRQRSEDNDLESGGSSEPGDP
jgi:hypothetical protein